MNINRPAFRIPALFVLLALVTIATLWLGQARPVNVFETREASTRRILSDPRDFSVLPLEDRTPEMFRLAVRTAEEKGIRDMDYLFIGMYKNPKNTVWYAGEMVLPRYPSRLLRFPSSWWTPTRVKAAAEMSGYWGFLVAREAPKGIPAELWRKMALENNRSDFRFEAPTEVQAELARQYPAEFTYDAGGLHWKS